jgi:CheY-like chemotaxis protein
MPEGGKLTIETSNAYLDDQYVARFGNLKSGQYVMLSVSDTGVGIPREALDRVFEPFYTTKETGKGTGLGLSMVHGFIAQSGGHVRIYSEVGAGTSVKMYLPRAEENSTKAVSPAGSPVDLDAVPSAIPGEAILLVEDDPGVRTYATEVLEDLGYLIFAASSGAEALELARGHKFDLLFTDVVLPDGKSGRDVANALAETTSDFVVLFTTGYTRNAIVHHGRLDADVNLIQKPYTQRELAVKIRRILDGLRAAR